MINIYAVETVEYSHFFLAKNPWLYDVQLDGSYMAMERRTAQISSCRRDRIASY